MLLLVSNSKIVSEETLYKVKDVVINLDYPEDNLVIKKYDHSHKVLEIIFNNGYIKLLSSELGLISFTIYVKEKGRYKRKFYKIFNDEDDLIDQLLIKLLELLL